MSDPMDREAPFSVGKVRRSRMVFGDIVVDDSSTNQSMHSLMYSPSPVPDHEEQSRDAPTPMAIRFDYNKQDDTSSVNKTVPAVNGPFSAIIGNSDTTTKSLSGDSDTMKENVLENSIASVSHSSKTVAPPPAPKRNANERSAFRRDLGQKTQAAINLATESVNDTLNAVRQAKQDSRQERVLETSKIRRQWRDEKEQIQAFNAEAEKSRRELLALKKHLSSKVYKAKAKQQLDENQARRDAIEKESQFKSEVFRDHQRDLKQELERKRRASIEARTKLRRNHRAGEEKMRMMAIEENMVLMEERQLSSLAWRESKRQQAEQRRKSFSFRNGDARRIRNLHAKMERERMDKEHNSFELKWAGEKDAEAYQKKMDQERRDSLAFRNEDGNRQRSEESQRRCEEAELEHASYELKRAGEKDVEAYKKSMAEERRDSFAFRNHEGRTQRKEEKGRQLGAEAEKHASYELKWAGEKDAEAYRKQLENERRDSFAFRNREGHRQRKEDDKRQELEQLSEHASYELKWDGERDAAEYKRQMEEERRNSLACRNRHRAQQQRVLKELQTLAHEKETESLALKWAGEDDARAYLAECEEKRRESFRFRNQEGSRHRLLETEAHSKQVQEAQAEEELQAACREDVEHYKEECAARDRASLCFRGKESQIHRLEEENEREMQREVDEKNRELDDEARRDVKQYLEDCKKRRRMSLALRAKEKRHHAQWKKQQEEIERDDRSRDTRDQAMDRRYVELARQQERARIAMDAIRHASCTFSVNPFAAILE